jgi:predicted nucleotidyltransferase component of viral defense system
MSERDYRKLYRIQNKVLEALKPVLTDFYLTGGTALGRFYLNHRFSEDLDFFVNSDPDFQKKMNLIEKRLNYEFSLLREQTVVYDDYTKYLIAFEDSFLKIEFVNDVQYRCGKPLGYKGLKGLKSCKLGS